MIDQGGAREQKVAGKERVTPGRKVLFSSGPVEYPHPARATRTTLWKVTKVTHGLAAPPLPNLPSRRALMPCFRYST